MVVARLIEAKEIGGKGFGRKLRFHIPTAMQPHPQQSNPLKQKNQSPIVCSRLRNGICAKSRMNDSRFFHHS
jgi:hypothetical protein